MPKAQGHPDPHTRRVQCHPSDTVPKPLRGPDLHTVTNNDATAPKPPLYNNNTSSDGEQP